MTIFVTRKRFSFNLPPITYLLMHFQGNENKKQSNVKKRKKEKEKKRKNRK